MSIIESTSHFNDFLSFRSSLFLLVFMALFPMALQSQGALEMGVFVGASNYQGDLAEEQIQFSETHPAFGILVRKRLNHMFGIRAGATYAILSGDDKNFDNEALRTRKFRFQSQVLEISAVGEWYIFGKKRFNQVGVFEPSITPYVFAGIGYAFAEADTECYTKECLEGSETPFPEEDYKPNYPVIPLGAGVRFDFIESLVFGVEAGFRATLSDYVDGVSERGREDKNDWFVFVGATATFLLGVNAFNN